MTNKKINTRTRRPSDAGPAAGAGQRGDLARRARAFGDAARAAMESCERGADAEAELRARRNTSGQ